MAYNFLRWDRDQPFLLPPGLRDWLPADHLAWFVLDVVDQLDLTGFYASYRADGHGHPAYDPKTLLGVLLYAYATGVRSSRSSNGAARRTSPSGCWPATSSPTT
jgi:transposase